MAIVKNPIILPLQGLIGLAPTPTPLVLDDENISLVLPLVPDITRRSQAPAGTGWFLGIMENVHSAGDDESSAMDPYVPGDAAIPPYPNPVPAGFDIWLAGVSLIRNSGTGGLTIGTMLVNVDDPSQGLGIDDAGAVVVSTLFQCVATFDNIVATQRGADPGETQAGLTYQPIKLRQPRGVSWTFDTTSAAAAEFQLQIVFGLFPEGLGQDVAF